MSAKWHCRTLEETLEFISARQIYGGLPMVGTTFEQDEAAEFIIDANYEGYPPGSGRGPNDVAVAEFIFSSSMEKERIETHPKYISLKEQFGWDEENRMFALEAPIAAGDEGLPGADGEEPEPSPIAGVDSWLVMGAEYRVTYGTRTIPGGIWLGIGTIINRPPGIGQFNLKLGKRNFLKLAPEVTKRGNAVTITLKYQLSGPKGAPKEIYSAGQLDPDSDGEEGTDPINLPVTLPLL